MAKPEAGKVVELGSKADFDAFLKNAGSNLVVIDFYAVWCGPCKMIAPTIEEMAAEYKEKGVYFAKVNVDSNQDTAVAEGIRSMPTIKFYKNGEKVAEQVGAVPKSVLDKKLKENI